MFVLSNVLSKGQWSWFCDCWLKPSGPAWDETSADTGWLCSFFTFPALTHVGHAAHSFWWALSALLKFWIWFILFSFKKGLVWAILTQFWFLGGSTGPHYVCYFGFSILEKGCLFLFFLLHIFFFLNDLAETTMHKTNALVTSKLATVSLFTSSSSLLWSRLSIL